MRYQKVIKYIEGNENLKLFFNYYLTNSDSISSPFYNFDYIVDVMFHICSIYEKSQQDGYEFKLDEQALYVLLLSAIFVNFYVNYDQSDITCKHISTCIMESAVNNLLEDDIKEQLIDIVSENIKACVYPYIVKDEDLNLYQRIIRESCLLVFINNDLQRLISLRKASSYTNWVDFLSNHIQFILNEAKELKLNYSKEYIDDNMENCLKCINDFYKLIGK